jgi:hypothetical protein
MAFLRQLPGFKKASKGLNDHKRWADERETAGRTRQNVWGTATLSNQ